MDTLIKLVQHGIGGNCKKCRSKRASLHDTRANEEQYPKIAMGIYDDCRNKREHASAHVVEGRSEIEGPEDRKAGARIEAIGTGDTIERNCVVEEISAMPAREDSCKHHP